MSAMAAVFAGQGAQSVGMGRSLIEASREGRGLFDRASEVLGFDLAALCAEGPESELTRTSNCQPAIFVVSAACWQTLLARKDGLRFEVAAGLSLGEWTALYAAGAIEFEQGVRILAARGRFMQEACEERAGGMVSVMRLTGPQIDTICEQTGVTVANINSGEQVVLSGPVEAVADAEKAATGLGGRAVVLNVAGAYHSPLMGSAASKLDALLAGETFATPRFPVLSNVTGAPHGDPAAMRAAMVAQVTGPVQWLKSIEWCGASGVSTYVELGPGKVLSGLIRRIDRNATVHNIAEAGQAEAVAAAL